jgi:two-component system sensor histidine kinase UhpB
LQGPDTDVQQLKVWADRIQNNLPYGGDLVIYTRDGQKRVHHVTGQPFTNEKGDVTRYFAIGYDVTEQRRMEEEKLRYQVEEQKKITRIILEAQELERNLLGRELHDNINQLLAAIRIQMSFCLENVSSCQPVIVQCRENVIQAMEEIRCLSHRMVMPRFEERSLPQMLQNLANNYRYAQSIRLDVSRWKDDRVPVPVKEVFFRVAQEQLSNIYKHAKATQVTIRIASWHDSVALAVEDNGIGFSPAEKTGGIGLGNIHSRVESYDGACRIISAPGQGCTLLVDIPLATG